MRMPPAVLIAPLLLGACSSPSTVSVELRRDGELVYTCDAASVSELDPKPGGWAFKCGPSSLYVMYDTGEGPAKGTIKTVELTQEGGRTEFRAGYLVPDSGCENAEAGEAGPAALPSKRGAVAKGTHAIAMAEPCAKLELVVGDPR